MYYTKNSNKNRIKMNKNQSNSKSNSNHSGSKTIPHFVKFNSTKKMKKKYKISN